MITNRRNMNTNESIQIGNSELMKEFLYFSSKLDSSGSIKPEIWKRIRLRRSIERKIRKNIRCY